MATIATDPLDEIHAAVRVLSSAADDLGEAANELLAGTTGIGAAGVAGGVLLAADGVDDVSAKVFRRALQLLGRALLGIGNEASAIADIGGRQYSSKNVAGDKLAKTWSDDLLKMTGEQYRLSANSYAESLRHVANSERGRAFIGDAAKNTLAAARETLKAANANGGNNAAIIALAEKAVALAQLAVDVIERASKHGDNGASAASAALQAAGKALIVVGNAVNSNLTGERGAVIAAFVLVT